MAIQSTRKSQVGPRRSQTWDPVRDYGEEGNNVIYFRGKGEHESKNKENRGTNVILGNRAHRKLRLWFWVIRENAEIFQGNKERVTHSLGGLQTYTYVLILKRYSTRRASLIQKLKLVSTPNHKYRKEVYDAMTLNQRSIDVVRTLCAHWVLKA